MKTAIMIDSSIFRQIPKLNSPLFQQLIKYIRIGRFNLYISEIVEKEYLTWIQTEAQEAYDTVLKASVSLNKFYDEPGLFGIKLHFNITADVAGNQINEILKKIVANWNNFKSQTDAIVLPVNNEHGKLVMDAYFNGSTPFKSRKSRPDIPDAFIYYSLLDLLNEYEEVVFISQDKAFCTKIKSDRVIVFNNLPELFCCDDYKLSSDYFRELPINKQTEFLFQFYKDEIIKKTGREIELSDLISDLESEYRNNVIGNYKNESSVAEDIQFDYANLKTISSKAYLIPFSSIISYTLSSEASKNDLDYYSKERTEQLAEKTINEDGMYDISEVIKTPVIGNASVMFSETDPLSWEKIESKHSFFKEFEISEITVTIENIEKKRPTTAST